MGLEALILMKTYLAAILAGVLALSATAAFAQDESTNRVNAETDWSVFVEDDPTQCWVVSTPSETVNTRDGRVVSVQRGEILMFVSFWPGQERLGEVSFTGGYPFADGSTVTMAIGETSFELFTDGEMAWAASPRTSDAMARVRSPTSAEPTPPSMFSSADERPPISSALLGAFAPPTCVAITRSP